MVVTPGFALYERFCPYATWYVITRVHTRLLLDKTAYSLRHTLFIIDLAHIEFLSSLPSVLSVDTSDLHYLTGSSRHILSSTTSSRRLPSSSSSGLPSRTTLCIILPKISPFGLDGNHYGVWSPQQIGTIRIQWHHVTLPILWHHYLHSNTMSLSPFDIKGEGRIKNHHKVFLLM